VTDAPQRDSGLPAERTSLAWSRTILAMVVNGALVVRGGIVSGSAPVTVIGGVLVLASAGLTIYLRVRRRALVHGGRSVSIPPLAFQLTAAIGVLLCVAAVVAFVMGSW
jgi:uncharacterized membrane protein YidH (DUF202 family)